MSVKTNCVCDFCGEIIYPGAARHRVRTYADEPLNGMAYAVDLDFCSFPCMSKFFDADRASVQSRIGKAIEG